MKYVQPIGGAVNAPYVDANPSSGVEGSPVPAAAIEHPQREIEAVITGAGLVPSSGDLTQLRQAITKMMQSGQRAVVINNATFAGTVTGTGKAVYWDAGNSRFDLAVADGTVKQNCVGFADVPNSQVYAFGDTVLFAGLTPGRYYLDGATPGAITVTAPTNAVFVGIARTATEMFVDVDTQPTTQVKQIQSITATVAANALTLGLNPTSLDFRSATLNSGVPNTRVISSALSLVVPSGATLGTVSGVAARLVLLAIDNAGTVELAVANLAGGINFDETTLISTTAISAAATTANVIYSTTARSNVPFRVVGFIDITETTAGTWATGPTTIQGVGGQALAAMSSLGYGQGYQDVTGSRAVGTTYYNTTGKPLIVSVIGTASQQNVGNGAYVNGVLIAQSAQFFTTAANQSCLSFVVPPGASYQVTNTSLSKWCELR